MQKSLIVSAILALVANFFWATNAIVGKILLADIPAFTLSQYRWWFALIILLPFGWRPICQEWHWYKSNFLALIGLAILSVTLYNTLQYWALEFTQPVNVGALLAFMPIAIALVARIFGARKLSLLEWVAIAVAVYGAVLVVTKGDLLTLIAGGTGVGELLLILAILSWAFYSVLLKRLGANTIQPLGLLTFFVLVGSVFIVPFWLFDVAKGSSWYPAQNLWMPIAYLALFPSIVALFAWNASISKGDATVSGLMVTSAPLFNAVLSMIFLSQQIVFWQWLGIVLIIVGVGSSLLIGRRIGT